MKNKRKTVRVICFLSALVIVLSVWGGVNAFNLAIAKREIRSANERALSQLGVYLDDINLNLQKAMYSDSEEMLSYVSSEIRRSSASAKESLSELTDSNTEISNVYKFLSQVGEYTKRINEKISKDEPITKRERENLEKLISYSDALNKKVGELIKNHEDGLLDFEKVKSTLQEEDNKEGRMQLGYQLNDANQSLHEYPTLIYDGPFSDHINNKKPTLIEKKKKVSQAMAQKKAADFLGLKENQIDLLSKTNGNMSTYNFYNGDYSISVTQKGGIVSSFLSSRYASEIKLTPKQAIAKARKFLNEKGYIHTKDSYYSTTDGICTINFSYYKDGVTYYTDLIKVSVAMDDGEITAFDATGYIMNHKKRSVPDKVKYTISQGKEKVKKDLTIKSAKKVFIPTEWETEKFAYEYHCKARDGKEVLIYIDPISGKETDILILLYSDGGVLTR